MEAAQDLMQRVEAALRYPADDPHSTMVVVLIVITAAILAALVLIAVAIPSRRLTEPDDSTPDLPDESFYDPDAEDETPEQE